MQAVTISVSISQNQSSRYMVLMLLARWSSAVN